MNRERARYATFCLCRPSSKGQFSDRCYNTTLCGIPPSRITVVMGIPAAFRWLSTKYPKIVSPVIEEHPEVIDGVKVPIDALRANPNGEEFDNLYLDMNGIVHPCSHPEDRPPPANEEEMMEEIFKYTERVFNMVRPRKLLMIAVGTLCASPY